MLVNGLAYKELPGNQIVIIDRTWKSGDVVELTLPMNVFKNQWYENSVSIERGPLTYALKIGEERKTVKNEKDPIEYGSEYMEVRPITPWNYGLVELPSNAVEQNVNVVKKEVDSTYPWNVANAPTEIRLKARRIPSWQLYNEMTGPIPFSITNGLETGEEEEITLIPYGCTTLRISQFPVLRKRE